MSKGMKIAVTVLTAFFGLSFLHIWLNIGFEKFRWKGKEAPESSFRVGFLPVT